jgi:hypothetical protein
MMADEEWRIADGLGLDLADMYVNVGKKKKMMKKKKSRRKRWLEHGRTNGLAAHVG